MKKPYVTLLDVKAALRDGRFRLTLPKELDEDMAKFLQDPSCTCNLPFYRKILSLCKTQLETYFPGKEVLAPEEEAKQLAQNNWKVINCHINELEGVLRNLGPGRKLVAPCRWQDQVTVVINELDLIY